MLSMIFFDLIPEALESLDFALTNVRGKRFLPFVVFGVVVVGLGRQAGTETH